MSRRPAAIFRRAPALEHSRRADYFCAMPIYEFHCAQCERDSEILVRSAEWRGTKCPHCGSTRLDKKLSTFASAGAGNDTNASKNPSVAAATAVIEAGKFAA